MGLYSPAVGECGICKYTQSDEDKDVKKKKEMLGLLALKCQWKTSFILVYEFEGKCFMLVEQETSYPENFSVGSVPNWDLE